MCPSVANLVVRGHSCLTELSCSDRQKEAAMLRPTDLLGRTSSIQGVQATLPIVKLRCALRQTATLAHTAPAINKPAWLRRSTFYRGLLALSLPPTLAASTIFPGGRPALAINTPAAAFAVQGAAPAFAGDLPVSDSLAALEEDEGDLGAAPALDGSLTFGQPLDKPEATSNKAGAVTTANVNLRSGPGTRYRVLGKLSSGARLEILGQQQGWYRVATAKGNIGWVAAEYFKLGSAPAAAKAVTTGAATVAQSRVNLRKGPGTSYGSYGKMAAGTSVTVVARSGEWYQVRSPRGTLGWVAAGLLTLAPGTARAVPVTGEAAVAPKRAAPAAAAAARPSVAAPMRGAASIARRYIGARYVWGGATPRGFDCSGLTQYVYRQLGVNLPHKASLQFSTRYGRRVNSLGALAPGDLVFFVRTTPARGITHVGIYVGDGRMVTANTPRLGVQSVNVYGKYWSSRFAGAIRPTG